MRQILSSIDIGSDYIKLIIGEFNNDRLHVLCATKVPSAGIENGKIIGREELVSAIRACVNEASERLGSEIKKVLLCSNFASTKLKKNVCEIKIEGEDKTITGKDIVDVLGKCSSGKIDQDYMILETIPVDFGIQGEILIKDPKGCESDSLAVKAIITEALKDEIDAYIGVITEAGLKVVDVIPNVVGDYYNYKNMERDNDSGAIVNIGYETTTVSIYHKGYITNTKTLKVGVLNIVEDIAYVKRLGIDTAKQLYSDFTIASSQLANTKAHRIVRDIEANDVTVYQYELAEIAESRIIDMLELIKKEINILTKKEISYIIISGGLTELKDFHLTISSVMGQNAKIGNIIDIGARDNAYVSAIGVLKYFHTKLALRDRNFSIFADTQLEDINNGVKVNNKDNNLLNRVFGYFFDS